MSAHARTTAPRVHAALAVVATVAVAVLARALNVANRWSQADAHSVQARMETAVATGAAGSQWFLARLRHPAYPTHPWMWWVATTLEPASDGTIRTVDVAQGWARTRAQAEQAAAQALDDWLEEYALTLIRDARDA